MKKVLVTGTCGFIFSNFIRKAIYSRSDIDIVCVDKVINPKTLNNVYVNKRSNMYIADVADPHIMDVIFNKERPDIVIHGAAESSVDFSIKDPLPFVHSNVMGTQVITNACVKYDIEKLIYISTDEVYGHLVNESDPAWVETAPLAPRNPYSASKAAGEFIVQAANATHGLKYNITRSCNNLGPRQLTLHNLIPKTIGSILNKKPITIHGQGTQLREWIFVDDNCDAVMTIMDKAPANEIYNISAGYETTVLEIVNDICNIMESGHDLITFVEDRKGQDHRYSVNANKLRALDWKPNFKYKEGLSACINWYCRNTWVFNR
ncbi:MAG TPA: NAD-dependent epimerase/dehydratase family protein [Anaerovoracaceae bacterium]|nr:NAD-dependent epimerase/dehydratase family protein [Anaerovoracaceae bacterium]